MALGGFVGAALLGVAGEAVPEIEDVGGEKELDVGSVNAGPVADGEAELEAMLSIRASRCADTVEMEFALSFGSHFFFLDLGITRVMVKRSRRMPFIFELLCKVRMAMPKSAISTSGLKPPRIVPFKSPLEQIRLYLIFGFMIQKRV